MTTKEARRSIQVAINQVKSERVVHGGHRGRSRLSLTDLNRGVARMERLIAGHRQAIKDLEQTLEAVEQMRPRGFGKP